VMGVLACRGISEKRDEKFEATVTSFGQGHRI
jgi:hypothetical protein